MHSVNQVTGVHIEKMWRVHLVRDRVMSGDYARFTREQAAHLFRIACIRVLCHLIPDLMRDDQIYGALTHQHSKDQDQAEDDTRLEQVTWNKMTVDYILSDQ